MSEKLKKLSIFVLSCILVVCCLAVIACTPPVQDDKQENEINFQIVSKEIALEIGQNGKIQILTDDDFAPAFSVEGDLISVDQQGVITAIKSGTAYVKVSAGEVFEYVKVVVLPINRSIVLDCNNLILVKGSEYQLNASILLNGEQISGDIEWTLSTDDTAKCQLIPNANGAKIMALESGIYLATALSGESSSSCKIKVLTSDAERLEMPQVTLEDCTKLTWQAVDGAQAYMVMVDDVTDWILTQETQMDVTSFVTDKNNVLVGQEKSVYITALSQDNCERVDSFIKTVNISHDYEIKESSKASCSEECAVEYVCSVCEHSYVDEKYTEEHDYNAKTLICSKCGKDRSANVSYSYDGNYVPMPTEIEASNPNSAWSIKYAPYYNDMLTSRWKDLVKNDKDGIFVDENIDVTTQEELNIARQNGWITHHDLYNAVYNNKDNIPEKDREACYFVSTCDSKGEETIYVKAEYDDGVHGALPVKYVGQQAFARVTAKKIIFPDSVTELAGECFASATTETIILPGVTFLPMMPEAYYMHNNFNYCLSLKSVVFGDGITAYGRHFYTTPGEYLPEGYVPPCTVYVMGTTPAFFTSTAGNETINNIMNFNFEYYYQPENLDEYKCGMWFFDQDMNVVYKDHDFSEYNICAHCGEMKTFNVKGGIIYEYSQTQKGYIITGLSNKSLEVVKPTSTFNDGVHGQANVVAVGEKAFANNTNITHVVLPSTVKNINTKAFRMCTNLTYLEATGISGKLYDIAFGCTNLKTLVVGNNTEIVSNSWGYDTGTGGQMEIYVNASSDVKISVVSNATLFSGRVYKLGAKNIDGTFYFDPDTGYAVKNTNGTYCEYIDGKLIDIWEPALCYTVNSDNASCTITGIGDVIKFNEEYPNGIVFVPEKIDGYTVTAIGKAAFGVESGSERLTYIKKVVLPNTVTRIEDKAFRHCTGLTYLDVGTGISSLGQIAYGCDALVTIIVNNGTIFNAKGWETTGGVGKLNVYLRAGETPSVSITNVVNTLFTNKVYFYSEAEVDGGWRYVDGIVTPYDVDSYYYYQDGILYKSWGEAFTYTVNADGTSIKITGRGDGFAFHCPGGVVEIPETIDGYTVTAIGAGAFGVVSGSATVTDVKKVVLPDTVMSIESKAFRNCTGLTYLDLGGATTVYDIAYNCCNLATLIVKNGTQINSNSWSNESAINDGKMSVYIKDATTIPSLNVDKINSTTMFSNKVYVYSETEVAGGWRYVDDVATPYNADSYYAYDNGTLTLNSAN